MEEGHYQVQVGREILRLQVPHKEIQEDQVKPLDYQLQVEEVVEQEPLEEMEQHQIVDRQELEEQVQQIQ